MITPALLVLLQQTELNSKVAVAPVVSPSNIKDSDSDLRRQALWLAALQDAFLNVPECVMVDLSPSLLKGSIVRLREAGAAKNPSEAVRIPSELQRILMAAFLGRTTLTNEYGTVYLRDPGAAVTYANNCVKLAKYLNEANGDELNKLATSGLPFSKSSAALQTYVASNCGLPGIQKLIASQQYVYVRLVIDGSVLVPLRSGKLLNLPLNAFAGREDSDGAIYEKVRNEHQASVSAPGVKKTERLNLTTLDYSAGKIVSFQSLVSEANERFRIKLQFDGRLADSLIYIQGKFTKDAITSMASRYMKLAPLKDSPSNLVAWNQLVSTAERVLPNVLATSATSHGLPYSEIFAKQSVPIKELLKLYPSLKTLVDRERIDPNLAVKLSPAFYLIVKSDGSDREPEDAAGSSSVSNEISSVFVPPQP